MVLTKKKSFSLNKTNNNRSRKINRLSQEGGETEEKPKHEPTPEQKTLTEKVKNDQKYKKENRLNLFIGFNEYFNFYEENMRNKKVSLLTEFYITGLTGLTNEFVLNAKDKNIKTNSLQELSNEINTVENPNILNAQLSLRQGGLPVCLVNKYRVYQMTTNDVQKMFLKKISRYLTNNRKTKSGGGSVNTFKIMNGGAEGKESHLVNALNNLLMIENLNETSTKRIKRIVDKLIEKMFSAIDKSYPEGEEENIAKDLENEIKQIFTNYLDDFLRNVEARVKYDKVKQSLKTEFSRDTLKRKLEERAGFQEKTPIELRGEAELKEKEKFHSEFLYQEGWDDNKKYLFRSFGFESSNNINFYVRKAFGYTEREIEERHQSYIILVIYESNLVDLVKEVVRTFELLRDSIYNEIPDNDSTPKSKESIFYDIITKKNIRLRKRNYGEIGTGYKDTKENDVPVSAIEFYSASRKVPVSSIIEFIKMLIEYTITKTTQLGETSAIDITYQLINERELML